MFITFVVGRIRVNGTEMRLIFPLLLLLYLGQNLLTYIILILVKLKAMLYLIIGFVHMRINLLFAIWRCANFSQSAASLQNDDLQFCKHGEKVSQGLFINSKHCTLCAILYIDKA